MHKDGNIPRGPLQSGYVSGDCRLMDKARAAETLISSTAGRYPYLLAKGLRNVLFIPSLFSGPHLNAS